MQSALISHCPSHVHHTPVFKAQDQLEISLSVYSYQTLFLFHTVDLNHVGFDRTQNIISFRYRVIV